MVFMTSFIPSGKIRIWMVPADYNIQIHKNVKQTDRLMFIYTTDCQTDVMFIYTTEKREGYNHVLWDYTSRTLMFLFK